MILGFSLTLFIFEVFKLGLFIKVFGIYLTKINIAYINEIEFSLNLKNNNDKIN